MPVREKRPPRPVASRGGPYGKPGRTVGMRRPRRPRRDLADAVFPIPAPNLELVGADGPGRGPAGCPGSAPERGTPSAAVRSGSRLPDRRSRLFHGHGAPRVGGPGRAPRGLAPYGAALHREPGAGTRPLVPA